MQQPLSYNYNYNNNKESSLREDSLLVSMGHRYRFANCQGCRLKPLRSDEIRFGLVSPRYG